MNQIHGHALLKTFLTDFFVTNILDIILLTHFIIFLNVDFSFSFRISTQVLVLELVKTSQGLFRIYIHISYPIKLKHLQMPSKSLFYPIK